jgi:hypothetical protein
MEMVDHVNQIRMEGPDDRICVMDREFRLVDTTYQVFAYIGSCGELEVNLASSTTGPRFVELDGADAARALRAAIRRDMEYFASRFGEPH